MYRPLRSWQRVCATRALGQPRFLLWRVTLKWRREVAAVLRPLGLTHPQFVVPAGTGWLGRHGSPPSRRGPAGHTGMDAMTASQVARTLETKKPIIREGDPRDTRIKRLRVTPDRGRAAPRAQLPWKRACRSSRARSSSICRITFW